MLNELALIGTIHLIIMVALVRSFGLSSHVFLFNASCFLYLICMPFSVASGELKFIAPEPNEKYIYAVIIYIAFYSLGVQCAESWVKVGPKFVRVAQFEGRGWHPILFIVAASLAMFSVATRNVFESEGQLLFSILGFDLLLVHYTLVRGRLGASQGAVYFIALTILFLYAGFRYRIAVLFLAELIYFVKASRSPVRNVSAIATGLGLAVLLNLYAQVRTYGAFDFNAFSEIDVNPIDLIAQGGEATVSIATTAVVNNIENIDAIYLEPYRILLTHFVPAVLYPSKPRALYLEAYFSVVPELSGTGTAMHDLAQTILMLGLGGLPLMAFVGGFLFSALRVVAVAIVPSARYAIAATVLFAVFVPTRGYLAQQITWALTFIVPVLAGVLIRTLRVDK